MLSVSKEEYQQNIRTRLDGWEKSPPTDQAEMMTFYDDWAQDYEKEKESVQYAGPRHVGEFLHKHAGHAGLGLDCSILDVAAGTGFVGQELKKLGYTNVDGLEPNEKMFQQARKKQVYREYINCAAGDSPMPIADASYDAAVIAGSLPHIKEPGLEDMIRVIKPGGLFVCAGKVNYVDKNAPWMMPTLYRLQEQGTLSKVEMDIPKDCYYMDFSALVLVYQKH